MIPVARAIAQVAAAVGVAASIPAPATAQQVTDLFKKVSHSVVLVRTLERGLSPVPSAGLTTIPGLGSGVVISGDGKIMTAAHVVQAADRVAVQFSDGKLYPAHVVASSLRADVALLQLDQFPIGLSPAPVGDSDSLEIGDQIIVIGAPYGLDHSLTVGHVSGRITGGGLVSGGPMEMIQTDASINQGNSGGPMFNMQGEVVGIVSRILTQSGGFEGVGFAISSKVANRVLLGTKSFWTGIDGVLLQDTLAAIFNVPQPAGFLVQQVAQRSPADLLGVKAGTIRARIGGDEMLVGGDIVLNVGGIAIAPDGASLDRIVNHLSALKAGDSLKVTVLRAGRVTRLAALKPR
ncbi:MAG TPA: trypsin-like peptidase domain-containing protein [Gemmatimonadales bacterium]|nr:trypsin-like peptidase domain-containing protein [Gemmatimonadales bacterium]